MSFPILIDTNRFISALLCGHALLLVFDERFSFYTIERITWEVRRYLPMVAHQTGISEDTLHAALEGLPFDVIPETEYRKLIPAARLLIGGRDPSDVDLLAASLQTKWPIWTHDGDFDGLSGVTVLRDSELDRTHPFQDGESG